MPSGMPGNGCNALRIPLAMSSRLARGGKTKIVWTEFQTEAVACISRENMQVSVEDFLTGRFSIGQE
jgi:hypothetical protein